MKILVINSGSSSIKFQLISMHKERVLSFGSIEKIGESIAYINMFSTSTNESLKKRQIISDHKQGMSKIFSFLTKDIKSLSELSGIGHRVVHGGNYKKPELINRSVIDEIKKVIPLAPLHNPSHLEGIEAAMFEAPRVPQVAIFDTAFHQTIPQYAHTYAIPYDYYERLHIRKYGFHGTSHQFVSQEAAKSLKKPLRECNFISLHLGNGASAAAIKGGICIDTSMGLTPLEGLMMGTRSGDIDPAVLFYISNHDDITTKGLDILLNQQSGLKGICGSNDMREVEEEAKMGNERAKLALHMFCYRIKKYIGSYFAILGQVDALIFTAGIGENSSIVREMICNNFKALGINLDKKVNLKKDKGILELQTKDSEVKILKVPTNEELAIARLTKKIVKKTHI